MWSGHEAHDALLSCDSEVREITDSYQGDKIIHICLHLFAVSGHPFFQHSRSIQNHNIKAQFVCNPISKLSFHILMWPQHILSRLTALARLQDFDRFWRLVLGIMLPDHMGFIVRPILNKSSNEAPTLMVNHAGSSEPCLLLSWTNRGKMEWCDDWGESMVQYSYNIHVDHLPRIHANSTGITCYSVSRTRYEAYSNRSIYAAPEEYTNKPYSWFNRGYFDVLEPAGYRLLLTHVLSILQRWDAEWSGPDWNRCSLDLGEAPAEVSQFDSTRESTTSYAIHQPTDRGTSGTSARAVVSQTIGRAALGLNSSYIRNQQDSIHPFLRISLSRSFNIFVRGIYLPSLWQTRRAMTSLIAFYGKSSNSLATTLTASSLNVTLWFVTLVVQDIFGV
ncbi:hypothetical protein DL93DRAFT_1002011 [Clavulina sp. PMI_390]|nr:hypothetical protein DL93DRAFT_1002011 [Clavulina sp. PMI_390]